MNDMPEFSPEVEEAARQMLVVISRFYESVFSSLSQLLQAWIEAAEREGLIPIR